MSEGVRWVWLGGSLLLAGMASQIAWLLWQRSETRAQVESFPLAGFLHHILRFLYYVGIPYAALNQGQVIGRLLGLQPLVSPDVAVNRADWAGDVAWAVGLGVAAWAFLATGSWFVHRAGVPHGPVAGALGWTTLREAVFYEVHWSFLRNAPLVTLTNTLGVDAGEYWGVWVGLALAALAAVLDPWWRSGLRDRQRAPVSLARAGMAVLSAVYYLQSGNLWLAILLHWGVTWGQALWMQSLKDPLDLPAC